MCPIGRGAGRLAYELIDDTLKVIRLVKWMRNDMMNIEWKWA